MKHHRTWAAAGAAAGLTAALFGLAGPADAATTVNVSPAGTDSATCGAVGDECRTITQAIANVDDGGTVNVAAGAYVERVDITKPLTLIGAGPTLTIVGNGTNLGAGAGLIRIGGVDDAHFIQGDVTVRGLRVDGVSGATPLGIYLDSRSAAGTTTTLEDLSVVGIQAADYGLYCEDHDANVVLRTSEFLEHASNPVLFEGCTGAVTIHDNFVNKSIGLGSAIFDMLNFGRTASGPHIVEGNVVTGASVSFVTGLVGLAPGSFAGISAVGNLLTGGGITVSNQSTAVNAAAGEIQGAVVQGNTLLGGGAANGVAVSGLVTGTTIAGNTISGYATGINVAAATAGHEPSGTVAVANRIVANSVGAASTATSQLAAEDNWWGCNEGPSGCGGTTGAVDADPWVVLGITASPTTVGLNEASAITADLTTNSDGDTAAGTFPDGASVAFGTNLGAVDPTSALLTGRAAGTTFSSASAGTATVTATLDGETVSTPVVVTAPPPPAPTCKLIKLSIAIPLLGIKPIVICI